MTRKCPTCGEEFETDYTGNRKGNPRVAFCSDACFEREMWEQRKLTHMKPRMRTQHSFYWWQDAGLRG